MSYPVITHHGGVESVTGSCHQLDFDQHHSVLIDCGLRVESVGGDVDSRIEFALHTIKALVLTHVHIDHVGRIPDLLAAGYCGPIICSEPSAKMLPITLEDAYGHQFGRDNQELGRYLDIVQKRTIALPFNTWYDLLDTPALHVSIRLQRAGHILGSAYVECQITYPGEHREKRVVFSGDLGSAHNPLLRAPAAPERADILVLESTYGNRLHSDRSLRQAHLEQVIDKALADHGTILIPAFSIGRTQELLFEIEDILRRKALLDDADEHCTSASSNLPIDWPQLPVVLDSPLASRFTKIYEEFDSYWNHGAQQRLSEGRNPLAFKQLITVDSHEKHLTVVNYLASTGRPAIVIAGSGMCSGGRIVNYLKAMLGHSRHNVVFVGYQAKGTPGVAIQNYGPVGGYVELDKDKYIIKAGITTVGGYSAHADQEELVAFVTGMPEWPAEIILTHGEPRAKKALGEVLERKYALKKRALKLTVPRK